MEFTERYCINSEMIGIDFKKIKTFCLKPFKLSALDSHLFSGFTHSIKTYQAVSLILGSLRKP